MYTTKCIDFRIIFYCLLAIIPQHSKEPSHHPKKFPGGYSSLPDLSNHIPVFSLHRKVLTVLEFFLKSGIIQGVHFCRCFYYSKYVSFMLLHIPPRLFLLLGVSFYEHSTHPFSCLWTLGLFGVWGGYK